MCHIFSIYGIVFSSYPWLKRNKNENIMVIIYCKSPISSHNSSPPTPFLNTDPSSLTSKRKKKENAKIKCIMWNIVYRVHHKKHIKVICVCIYVLSWLCLGVGKVINYQGTYICIISKMPLSCTYIWTGEKICCYMSIKAAVFDITT